MVLCLTLSRSAFGQSGADRSDGDSRRYECSALLATMRKNLLDEERHQILVQNPALADRPEIGENRLCDTFEKAARALQEGARRNAELGRLWDHRAALLSEGPHGSGHYWDLTLAVEIGGRIIGTCMTTSTSGWRNLSPEGHRLFGRWRALASGRLQIWSTLVAGAAEMESLLFPIVYRLSDGGLVVDHAATLTEIGKFGRLYAHVAAMQNDDSRALHQAAANAYRSFAAGTDCPQR